MITKIHSPIKVELDHIEKIEINTGHSSLSNFHSIHQLLEGIFMTYNNMNLLQENYWNLKYPDASNELIEIHKKASLSMHGQVTHVDAQVMNLFHWYSINIINYSKCCGLVKFLNQKKILPEELALNESLIGELYKFQKNYLDSIEELSPVLHFRNKAAAHLAYSTPDRRDNPATLIESMSLVPSLIHGKFTIGAITRKRGDHESSFSKHSWSLTENFESLIPRYFKNHLD